jgi:hypothetical protein
VGRTRGLDVGALIFGLVVLGVGIYYFAQKTLGLAMPELDWDRLWPLVVIAVGIGILVSNLSRNRTDGPGQ